MSLYDNDQPIKLDRTAAPIVNEHQSVTYKDEAWPEIGLDVQRVVELSKQRIPLRLTAHQLQLLNTEVVCPTGRYPSPVSERASYPDQWKLFIEHVHEMPQWKYRRPTMGTLVELLRSYHFIGGWFVYRPNARQQVEVREVPVESADTWLKPT